MKKAAVFCAEGFEEIEFITIVDLLRRAQIDVKVVAITPEKQVVGGHAITVIADMTVNGRFPDFDAYILPGGIKGTENLAASEKVRDIVVAACKKKRIVAAICAAPLALHQYGILKGKRCTSYPTVKEKLTGTRYTESDVVVDGTIVTSRGVGTAIQFSLKLIEMLQGRKMRDVIRKQILFRGKA